MGDLISTENLPFALLVVGLAFLAAPTFEGNIPFFGKIDWTDKKKTKSSRAIGAACLLVAAVAGGVLLLGDDDPPAEADGAESTTNGVDVGSPVSGCDLEAQAEAAAAYIAEKGYTIAWNDPDDDCLLTAYEVNSRGSSPNDADTNDNGTIDGLEVEGTVPSISEQLREGYPDGIPGSS